MRLGLSTKITQIRAVPLGPLVVYERTYAPLPAVSTGFNPDAEVYTTGGTGLWANAIDMLNNHELGRYGNKPANELEGIIFTRFEVDVPKDATILGVKIKFFATSGYAPVGGSLDVAGGFVLPDNNSPSSRNWQAAAGIAAWSSFSDVPMAKYYDSGNQTDFTVFQGGAAAFSASAVAMATGLWHEYSFGEGVDDMDISSPTTTVTGLIDQLQDYIDGAGDSLRGSIVTGKVPVLFQLYADEILTDLHFQGLICADFSGGTYAPQFTVKYESHVEPVGE